MHVCALKCSDNTNRHFSILNERQQAHPCQIEFKIRISDIKMSIPVTVRLHHVCYLKVNILSAFFDVIEYRNGFYFYHSPG
jgi:hypothetical protein